MKKSIVFMVIVLSFIFFSQSNFLLAANAKISASDFLETKGNKIVNQKGEEVVLRGYNIGLWLSRSFWGLPINIDHNADEKQ